MTTEFNLSVRQLNAADANAFRALRLKALKEEGEKFGPTYEDEVRLTYEDWEKRVTPTADTRLFGLFDNDKLVGAMRATLWEEDASGQTALLGQAYVLPPYRNRKAPDGTKLTAPLYARRAEWTKTRYTSAVTYIRQDNPASQTPHLKHGAKLMFSRFIDWPGRVPVAWNFYRIAFDATANQNQQAAPRFIEATHAVLSPQPEPARTERKGNALPAFKIPLDQQKLG